MYIMISIDKELPKQYSTKCMGMYEEHSKYLIELAQKDKLNLGKIPVHQRDMN